jgi:hypothetical protein
VGGDESETDYLTRLDIARILRVSAKQAGLLMDRMPTVRVGKRTRRVHRRDFEAWSLWERELSVGGQHLTLMQQASRPQRKFKAPRSGLLIDAARRGGS